MLACLLAVTIKYSRKTVMLIIATDITAADHLDTDALIFLHLYRVSHMNIILFLSYIAGESGPCKIYKPT